MSTSIANDGATLRYQGTLEKQGKIMKSSWKKYWFILQDEQLIYCKEDAKSKSISKRSSSSSNQGEIQLNQVHTVKECPNVNHGYAFELTTKSRTYTLSAESAEVRQNWLKMLHEAMMLKNRNSSVGGGRPPLSSCRSIGEEEDGMYDAVDFNSNNPSDQVTPRKSHPSVTAGLMSVTGEARCYSEVFDDNYASVYDAKHDVDGDGDGNYAEVSDAIRIKPVNAEEENMVAAYAETSQTTGTVNSENVDDACSTSNDSNNVMSDDGGQNAYTYVQMRKKSALDYRAPARTPSGARSKSYSHSIQDNTYSEATSSPGQSDSSSKVIMRSSSTSCHNNNETETSSNLPSYSKVIPKSQRSQKGQLNESGPGNSSVDDYDPVIMPEDDCEDYQDYTQDEYDDVIESTQSSSSEYFELPHPRLELTEASAFDKIRLFLAEKRGPNEVFKTSNDVELGGVAIEKLKNFLMELDGDKKTSNDNGRVLSTYL